MKPAFADTPPAVLEVAINDIVRAVSVPPGARPASSVQRVPSGGRTSDSSLLAPLVEPRTVVAPPPTTQVTPSAPAAHVAAVVAPVVAPATQVAARPEPPQVAPDVPGRREPTGPQRVARVARALGVHPTDLAKRIRESRCAQCHAPIPYARSYFAKQHACEDCAPKLGEQTIASLAELERWI